MDPDSDVRHCSYTVIRFVVETRRTRRTRQKGETLCAAGSALS